MQKFLNGMDQLFSGSDVSLSDAIQESKRRNNTKPSSGESGDDGERPVIELYGRQTALMLACTLWASTSAFYLAYASVQHRRLSVEHYTLEATVLAAPVALAMLAAFGVVRRHSQLILFGTLGSVFWLFISVVACAWVVGRLWARGRQLFDCTAEGGDVDGPSPLPHQSVRACADDPGLVLAAVVAPLSVFVALIYVYWFNLVWRKAQQEETIRVRYLKGRELIMSIGDGPSKRY